jgi:predicted outer membrane protein
LRTAFYIHVFGTALLLSACDPGPEKDNKKIAEDINNKKFEKGEQEELAQHLVDIAACNKYVLQILDLTLEKSNDTNLVKLAANMHKDHERMDSELAFLAGAQGIVLPTTLEAAKKKELDGLRNEADDVFDGKVPLGLISIHKDLQEHLQKLLNSADDPSVSSWAEKEQRMMTDHIRWMQAYASPDALGK